MMLLFCWDSQKLHFLIDSQSMEKNIRQLAAVMFTDMVGYTALMQTDEHKAKKNRDRHRKVLEKSIQDHHGHILQYYGDGTLSVFGSVVEALECAVEIQQELQKEPQIPLRIGLHIGDIVYSDDGIYGDAVNVAARIEKLSVPGGVLISDKVYDEIKNHHEFSTTTLGEFELKNVKRPIELFALTNEGLQIPAKKTLKSSRLKRAAIKIKDSQYPFLETKLYVPQPRPDLVQRTDLIDRLNKGISRKLTLISAPAGFGKTTLISEWISQSEIPVAWISLDKGDSDPVHFIHYIIAALQSFDANIGEPVLTMLQSPQQPLIEFIMTNLIKEITDIPYDYVLVLDDYHLVDEKKVHNIVEFLLDHLPVQMHLVITTRVDPPLPLARLRVRNQLTEFRAPDLCFTVNETTVFFNKMMNLGLSSHEISILESRTEGWIAGLQLAALSMQGREDIHSFIKTFAGDDRHIVDYLAEEVLNLQPEHVQNFLLQTSILKRLSAPLCDFVTAKKGS
jgi:LuxR family maltose regulon positive regulatory protein